MSAPPPARPFLAVHEERLRLAAEAAGVGAFDFDPVTGGLFWDERLKALFGLPPDAPVDYDVFLAVTHPDDRERAHGVVAQALDPNGGTGGEYAVEFRPSAPAEDGGERWLLARGRAFFDAERTRAERFVGAVIDVTERRRAEDALRESERRFAAVFEQATAGIAQADLAGRFVLVNDRYCELLGRTREELLGLRMQDVTHPGDLTGNLPLFRAAAERGEGFVIEKRYARPDGTWAWANVQVSAVRDASGGVQFIQAVVLDLTERRRLEQERERLLDEQRRLLAQESARAEREALVNQIGDGIRQSLPPEKIEEVAVAALGGALAADRCYLMSVDLPGDAITIVRDWRAEGVPSMAGQYRVSELGVDFASLFASGETLVVSDARPESERRLSDQNAQTNERVGVSSFLNVPFFEGERIVGALGVAMAGGARHWTVEEITLAETVAGQLRSVLEAARLQQRERNIAERLQEALTPPSPPPLPGLSLASHYRPALAEAGVGGDFFDVFPVEKGCTALVVGDLAGKGLAAASEVATVRNMVRYALYSSGRTLAEAVAGLHDILVEHDLLTGFATLFVGVYDQNRRTLTYVNAGQEPALIWRVATGAVERLMPTGPVLGGFAGEFAEATVTLAPGDVLAAFTDGLTDVGATRKGLLGVQGVADLLSGCCSGAQLRHDAGALLRRLTAGVDAFAQGRVGDDTALLIGVVGGVVGGDADKGDQGRG